MERYHVRLLLTYESGEEEIRIFHVDAWNADEAIALAKRQARQDDSVVEAECQMVS